MKHRCFNKWYLLLAILLCGAGFVLFFKEDPISLAKERLKTKEFSVKPAPRSNSIDRSIRDVKSLLKMEEIRVTRSDYYTVTESLEGVEELNTLSPFIESFNCGLTKVRDSDALVIGKMHQLRRLQIYGPDLTNQGVSALSELKDLEWLELYAPQATEEGLSWLHRCTQLHRLFLTDARLGTRTVQQIANHRKLSRIDMQGTWVKSTDLQYLTQLPELHMLELSGTFLDDKAAPYFRQMKSLGTLHLNETEVGDQVCQALATLPKLNSLILDDTLITDQGVQLLLEGCPELKSLSIRRCDITGKAFAAVKFWPVNLERLTVTGNKLTGAEILKILNDHESLESIGYNSKNFDPDIVKQIDSITEARLHRSLYGR
ncbi:MAG: hypothetical protein ABIK07_15955 [Planctomycetota bacterium]